MSRAVFIEADGSFTYVLGDTSYDLGHPSAGRYIWAYRNAQDNRQVCEGGGWRGVTLEWPLGQYEGSRTGYDRLNRQMEVAIYANPPLDEVLRWLGKALNATTYKTRASFKRHYKMPVSEPF